MKNKPCIITISGEAQHGKDTTCQLLVEELTKLGWKSMRIAYADYLKHLARVLYGWDGQKDEKGRTILQSLGHSVRQTRPDFWVATVEATVEAVLPDIDYVIIPDTRYPNEIEYWRSKGYNPIAIKVERLGFDNGLTEEQKNHSSETALNTYCFDFRLTNTSLDSLRQQVAAVLVNIGI